MRKIIDEAYEKAKSLLLENRDKLDLLAGRLIDKETLYESEVSELLGLKAGKEKEEDKSGEKDAS